MSRNTLVLRVRIESCGPRAIVDYEVTAPCHNAIISSSGFTRAVPSPAHGNHRRRAARALALAIARSLLASEPNG